MNEYGVLIAQVWARGMRGLVLGVIGLWAVLGSGPVLAQTGAQSPEDFLNGLAKLDSSYAPAGSGETGEAVDLYTGSLGFVTTDVSLPGNSDLKVALTRHFSVGSPGGTGEDYAFADWQLEVPVITGIVAGDPQTSTPSSGWRYTTGTGSNAFDRCSHFGNLPQIGVQNPSSVFDPDEYWGGFHLQIPGAGSQMLLSRAPSNVHAPSANIEGYQGTTDFRVVTKDDWVAACLPSLANSEPGEGFLVIAPDGRKFWFDWLVYEPTLAIDKPANTPAFASPDSTADTDQPQASSGTARLPRLEARLYATRVEDRFGHRVDYTYGGPNNNELTHIEADDGRQITIHWTNGHIDQVTAQPQLDNNGDPQTHSRNWLYGYDSFNASLTAVMLPDNSTWDYDLKTLAHAALSLDGAECNEVSGNYSNGGAGGATISGSVTTPGGLAVAYDLVDTARGHADTPTTCLYPHKDVDNPGQPAYAETYFVWALATRTESGPGVTSRTWNYDYSDAHGSWHYQCSSGCPYDSVWTQVTDPEGRSIKYTYSNVFDASEGQLRTVEYRNSASGSVIRSQSRLYADADAGIWPETYGYPSTSSGATRTNAAREGTQTPLKTRTTSEGGISYTWTASSWDGYAPPTDVTRASTGTYGDSVSETLAYDYNTALWVLGQFQSRTVTAPSADAGKVPESRSYHAGDATLDTISRFGHTVATYTWYPVSNAAAGELASVKDGNNHSTTYSSYLYGVPETIGYADGTSIGLTPNNYGEVLEVSDELGHTTTVERDDLGRITHKSFPLDRGQSWDAVDIAYQQIATNEYGVSGTHWRVTRTQGRNKQVTVYDAALNPVLGYAVDTSTSPDTGHMTWHQYDSAGNDIFTSYPLDYASSLPSSRPGVTTDYDVLGRATGSVADAEAPYGTVSTSTTYDTGNKVDVEDARGHHTVTTYQAFDQPTYDKPVKVQFASGITTTTITRDSFGAPTVMQQSGAWSGGTLSVTHSFGYDTYHRLCKQVSPETGTTGYGYDAADNLKWTAQGVSGDPCMPAYAPPLSAKITRSYDSRNRLTDIDYPSGTADKHFQYYDDGRTWKATRYASGTTPSSTWTMTYYNRGQLKNETLAIDGHSFALGYQYDSEGASKSDTYPSAGQINLAPDGLGRPTQLGIYADALSYDANGLPNTLTYGNGVDAAWGYNTRGLLDSTVYSLGGSDMTDRALTYDRNGNLAGIDDSIGCHDPDVIFCSGFEEYDGTDVRSFVYDDLDRLTQLQSGENGNDNYSYDPLGNVRTATIPGTYNYDAVHNRISNVNGSSVYGHDTRGNVTSIGSFAFTWNRANELVSDGFNTSYAHDARGWRVKRVVQAAHTADGVTHTRYFVYDNAHRLMLRWDNGVETDFLYLGQKPIARIEGGSVTYIHDNYQHSPLLETNSRGKIPRSPAYLGYGRTDTEGQQEIPGYTGAAMDRETGQVYLGARYLFRQRFTRPDPAPLDPTSPTGLNRYAYAADNPVNHTDPFGRCVRHSDPECNPRPMLPPPPEPKKPEISRTTRDLRNASDCSVLRSCTAAKRSDGTREGTKTKGATIAIGIQLSGNAIVKYDASAQISISWNLKKLNDLSQWRIGGILSLTPFTSASTSLGAGVGVLGSYSAVHDTSDLRGWGGTFGGTVGVGPMAGFDVGNVGPGNPRVYNGFVGAGFEVFPFSALPIEGHAGVSRTWAWSTGL